MFTVEEHWFRNLDQELITLIKELQKDTTFNKNWPNFKIVSAWRPNKTKDKPDWYIEKGRQSQEELWNQKNKPYQVAKFSAHNVNPACAFDFDSGNGRSNHAACWADISKIAKSKNIKTTSTYPKGDPVHVQLSKYSRGSVSSSTLAALSSFDDVDKLVVELKKSITVTATTPFTVGSSSKPSEFLKGMIANFENQDVYSKREKKPVVKSYLDPENNTKGLYSIGYGIQINTQNFDEATYAKRATYTMSYDDMIKKYEYALSLKAKDVNDNLAGAVLTQAQYDAVFDVAYTVGIGGITGLIKAVMSKSGDVPSKIIEYRKATNKAGVKVEVPGLVKRRYANAVMWKYGIYNPTFYISSRWNGYSSTNGNPTGAANALQDFWTKLGLVSSSSDSATTVEAAETYSNTTMYVYPFDPSNIWKKYVRFGRSSFTGGENSRYVKNKITMLDVLKEAEYRSPGSYFDVLEDGFFATLFFGRPNYYIDRTDAVNEKEKLEKESIEFFRSLNYTDAKNNIANFFNTFAPVTKDKDSTDNISAYRFDGTASDKIKMIKSLINRIRPYGDTGLTADNPDKPVPPASIKDKENYYERATNVVFAVSGKNLVSNNVIVNGNVANSITVDYNPSLWQKGLDFTKSLQFLSKVTLCTFPSIAEFEDRIVEKMIVDENIRNLSQAIEVAQSCLQKEIEKYYDGTVIIKFNPDVRYRTEILLYDNVNGMYGTFLVREFEHKFDSRGAYTIIKPMMKIEQNAMSANMIRSKFQKFFKSANTNSESADSSKTNLVTFREYFESVFINYNSNQRIVGDAFVTPELFEDLCGLYANKTPVSLGEYAIRHAKDSEDSATVLKSSYGLIPFKAFPLIKGSQLLMPDLDLVRLASDGWLAKFSRWCSDVAATGFKDFFTLSEKTKDTNLNLWEVIGNAFKARLKTNLGTPEYYTNISKNGVFSMVNETANNALTKRVKEIMQENGYNKSSPSTGLAPYSEDLKKISIGFMNCRILKVENKDRIKNIAKIISKFEFFTCVEVAARTANEAGQIHNLFVEELNKIAKQKKQTEFDTAPRYLLTRAKGLVTGTNANSLLNDGRRDEYTLLFNRKNIIYDNFDKINLGTFSYYTKYHSDSVTDLSNFIIYSAVATIHKIDSVTKKKTNSIKCAFLHNIYEPFAYSSSIIASDVNGDPILDTVGAPVMNSANRLKVIKKLLADSMAQKIDYIFGDFNTNILNYNIGKTMNSMEPAYTVFLTDGKFSPDSLSFASANGYTAVLGSKRTTITVNLENNAFDKLLVQEENIKRDKLISYGAYEAELTNDFKEYLENFSDHLPIYLVAKLDGGS